MVKFAIIGVNLLALLGFGYFLGDDVTVQQKLPTEVNAGESFTVEVTINKGEREGFAKWQQALPEGFVAEAQETQGATFSFKGQEVKLIWMALPKEESFTISYLVKSDPYIAGTFDVNGKFSFIDNNERKDIESEIATITVGMDLASMAASDQEEISEEDNEVTEEKSQEETDLVAEETKKEEKPTEEFESNTTAEQQTETVESKTDDLLTKTVTSIENVTIARNILELEDGKYEVQLSLQKGGLNDFGKIEEYLPEGFIATENNSNEGIFTFKNKVMKILWMKLPKTDVLQVSYFVESTNDDLDSVTIHGVFSYLESDNSKQIAMKGSTFRNTFVGEEVAEALAEIEEPKEEVVQEELAIEEIVEEVPEEDEPEQLTETTTKKSLEEEITNLPSVEKEISYRVQIAAGKKEVSENYFQKKHKISEAITVEYHETWYKYTIGSYNLYKEARDKRNQVWSNDNLINDAFVTAYNSGERISVQEALMISNQKWFK